ncbi:hypothetical protein D3C75_818690 [compost metagenome]
MQQTAAVALAIADHQVTAGALLQNERKVFTGGKGPQVVDQLPRSQPVLCDLAGERGLLGIVDQHRMTMLIVDVGPRPETGGLPLHQIGDPPFQQAAHLGGQRAHAQAHLGGFGNHVRRTPGMD